MGYTIRGDLYWALGQTELEKRQKEKPESVRLVVDKDNKPLKDRYDRTWVVIGEFNYTDQILEF